MSKFRPAEHVCKCGCNFYWYRRVNAWVWEVRFDDGEWEEHDKHETMLNNIDPSRVSAGYCMAAQGVGK